MKSLCFKMFLFVFCLYTVSLFAQSSNLFEGTIREQMERLDFSDKLIDASLRLNNGSKLYNSTANKYVRGIRAGDDRVIHEPDSFTWELTLTEHRNEVSKDIADAKNYYEQLHPMVFAQPSLLPENPYPLVVSPVNHNTIVEVSRVDVQRRMGQLIERAHIRGLGAHQELRARQMRQELNYNIYRQNHGYLDPVFPACPSSTNIPALLPAAPPYNAPTGTRTFSYDPAHE